MRVLMIADFYPPDYIGGAERHIQILSRELVRRGHHVAVATLRNRKESASFELDEGVRVHRLAGWNRILTPFYENPDFHFHPPLPDPGIAAGLRRVISQERPDIVHAHSWILYSFIGLKAWSRAKLVATFHTFGLVCPILTYLHNGRVCSGPGFAKCIHCASSRYGAIPAALQTSGLKLSSRLHRYVDRYITVSSAVRDAVSAGVGRPPRPIQVVPNFIPDNAANEAASTDRPSFLPPQDDYLLFVGRQYSHGQKGLEVLLDAYEGLSDLAPLVVMVSEEAREPAQRFGDGVTVARKVPHDQVMAGWAHCAVGVVPSIVPETFGMVAVEAMACGKPVVASAVGGLPGVIVDGESGVLVPPGDATALREALRGLLTNPARRARMGAAARQRAHLFTVSSVVGRIEGIYAEVLMGK